MTPSKSSKKSMWRPRNVILIVVGILLVLLVALQLLLEPLVLRFANKKLDEMPGYKGHIEDVDISLWRGAYTIEGVRLQKVEGNVPVPFFSARSADFSVEWKALLRGKVVSEITLDHPRLNFVSGPTKAQSQNDAEGWQKVVEDLFPLTINRFEILQGEIHFRDFHRTPKVDIHLDHLNAVATGLTNSQEQSSPLPATFKLTGRAMEHAPLRIDMKVAPLATDPTFDLNAELTDLELATLNDYFNAYAFMDVENGTLSLFTEMAAKEGGFKGYIKPLTKNLDIASLENDAQNPLRLAWETIVGAVGQIFENQPRAQVGTQIPFSGRFSDPNPDIWKTVGTLLRNAFIRALHPDLNNSIRFEGVPSRQEEKKQEKKESKKS
ncbi:MAG: hypothetical protein K0Q91_1502 [Fibrobacteria bacterium]|nr:hypothetical protein [Fibrobacteria bacterium]